jgi:aspartate 1-decarboxylase
MTRTMCKSKIHRATVTQAELNYIGSLTLDMDLMDAAKMIPFEQIQIVNVNNGARFETYLIPGERDSGIVCLNGPASRLAAVGDIIIIITYGQYDDRELENFEPTIVFVDKKNMITDEKNALALVEA